MVVRLHQFIAAGDGVRVTVIEWDNAFRAKAVGRHEDALVAAEQAAERPDELAVTDGGLVCGRGGVTARECGSNVRVRWIA